MGIYVQCSFALGHQQQLMQSTGVPMAGATFPLPSISPLGAPHPFPFTDRIFITKIQHFPTEF